MATKAKQQNFTLDIGVEEVLVNGHALRYQPMDPNLYNRFIAFCEEVPALEDRYDAALAGSGAPAGGEEGVPGDTKAAIAMLRQIDLDIKQSLDEVFACGNSFEELLDGVNIMAVTPTGETVLQTVMEFVAGLIDACADERFKAVKKRAKMTQAQLVAEREARRKAGRAAAAK